VRPSDPISRAESWILRVLSPLVGLGFGGWMIGTRSLSTEGVALVLGLGVARPVATALGRGRSDASSTSDSSPSKDSS
jgi:hypothetical protein